MIKLLDTGPTVLVYIPFQHKRTNSECWLGACLDQRIFPNGRLYSL